MEASTKKAVVIGGGIAGIQASLDLADMGIKVHLIEKKPSIGGRMAQLDKTFPTNDCSICILAPKLSECYRHPNITLHTLSEVKGIEGFAGNFTVKVLQHPRYVREDACINCGKCVEKCPTKVDDEFDRHLRKRKAIYLYYLQGVPSVVTIDPEHCLYLTKGACRLCQRNCDRDAIDFEQKPRTFFIEDVGAVIVATGYDVLEDKDGLSLYGYKGYRNVVSSLEFERLLCASGPQAGHLKRLSDGKSPKEIAFLQCIGSRNEKMNKYCSAVCCMYSTKEAMIAHEHDNSLKSYVFYIDLRAGGKGFQQFLARGKEEYDITYINSKVAGIKIDADENPIITYEDLDTGKICQKKVDLAVLATCMIPTRDHEQLARDLEIELDQSGFFRTSPHASIKTNREGIFCCGCSHEPMDIPRSVTEASCAAARAAEIIKSGGALS
ncbi:MAG: FAD-dependent oxidoreductase [Promethearchaeota archaeon]